VSTPQLTDREMDTIIGLALDEDTGKGDITSRALLPAGLVGRASLMVKEKGVLAGIDVTGRVFHQIDPTLKIDILIKDGHDVKPGDVASVISGSIISILQAERVALNFLQRLSGIASLTARYVAATGGTKAAIYDTRKTTPGMRSLEKYAVRTGGGRNHRLHLGDAVLIKDNHLAVLRATGMTLKDIIEKARQNTPAGTTVEVEVTSYAEALGALEAGADIIMLDNMPVDEMTKIVEAVAGRARLEASGGITLKNVRKVALTGVDMISVGALTHSFTALDISLELEPQTLRLI
jgi:nicotinate-nucleotide pyrophosphorylase (carboxylating)